MIGPEFPFFSEIRVRVNCPPAAESRFSETLSLAAFWPADWQAGNGALNYLGGQTRNNPLAWSIESR